MSLLSMLIMSANAHAEPATRPSLPQRGETPENTVLGTFHEVQDRVVYQGVGDVPLPTVSPVIAVMVDNVRIKRMVQVLPSADNELRAAFERPRAVQVIEASPGTMPPKNIIALIGDSQEDPVAYVTSPRPMVQSLIVSTPDTDVEVVDIPVNSQEYLLLPDEDTVLGVLVPGQQDSVKALMQVIDPVEMSALLELHQIEPGIGWPWLND